MTGIHKLRGPPIAALAPLVAALVAALALVFNAKGNTVDWTDPFWDESHSWLVSDDGPTSDFINLALGAADWEDSNGVLFSTAHPGKYFFLSSSGEEVMLNYLLPGDANLDRNVNLDDFALLRTNYGTGDTWAEADFNGDHAVNLDDFAVLRNNYGAYAPEPQYGSHAPEPVTMAGLMLGIGGLATYVRKRRTA